MTPLRRLFHRHRAEWTFPTFNYDRGGEYVEVCVTGCDAVRIPESPIRRERRWSKGNR